MTPQDKRKQTIRLQEKLKVQTFLKNKYRDALDEQEAMQRLWEYAKAKGRDNRIFSYADE